MSWEYWASCQIHWLSVDVPQLDFLTSLFNTNVQSQKSAFLFAGMCAYLYRLVGVLPLGDCHRSLSCASHRRRLDHCDVCHGVVGAAFA